MDKIRMTYDDGTNALKVDFDRENFENIVEAMEILQIHLTHMSGKFAVLFEQLSSEERTEIGL